MVTTLAEEDVVINHHSGILYRKIGLENLYLGKTKQALELTEKSISLLLDGVVSFADDALISLRYARRVCEGQGLTWSAGKPVEGYTDLLWVLLQVIGAWEQYAGIGRVASMAHLGGALVGVACWAAWRNLDAKPAPGVLPIRIQ